MNPDDEVPRVDAEEILNAFNALKNYSWQAQEAPPVWYEAPSTAGTLPHGDAAMRALLAKLQKDRNVLQLHVARLRPEIKELLAGTEEGWDMGQRVIPVPVGLMIKLMDFLNEL